MVFLLRSSNRKRFLILGSQHPFLGIGAVTQLHQVAEGRTSQASGYPFCRYYLMGIANDLVEDNVSHYRAYRFAIEILQETTAKSAGKPKPIFRARSKGS